MIVKILEIVKDIPVTSVVLERDTENPDNLSMFYCPKCSKPLIQYKGRLAFIYPGQTPCNMPLVLECERCKTKYLFRTNI